MKPSTLNLRNLDSTRATPLRAQVGESLPAGCEYFHRDFDWSEYGAPAEVYTFVSGTMGSGVAPAWRQPLIVFSPVDQDLSIRETPGEDPSIRLRNQLSSSFILGVHAGYDVEDLLGNLVRNFVGSSTGRSRVRSEFDAGLFRRSLIALVLDEAIEDGVSHPGEDLIHEALHRSRCECLDWLSGILNEHYKDRPSLCASILRCIGRLEQRQVGQWGLHVVDHALRSKDIEIRDAAVCALEEWGGDESVRILRRHHDTEDWLNAYVQQVIIDLSGNVS